MRSIETACVPEGERQVEQRLAGEKCILPIPNPNPPMINMGVAPTSSPNHPFMRLARGGELASGRLGHTHASQS